MKKRRILFPAIAILLVLLVVGVVFWPRADEGKVELIILETSWDTNNRVARVTYTLKNRTSRNTLFEYQSATLPFNIIFSDGENRSTRKRDLDYLKQLPANDPIRLLLDRVLGSRIPIPLDENKTNTIVVPNAHRRFQLRADVILAETNNADLPMKLIGKVDNKFRKFIPKSVMEMWGPKTRESITVRSDWITPTGIASVLPPP